MSLDGYKACGGLLADGGTEGTTMEAERGEEALPGGLQKRPHPEADEQPKGKAPQNREQPIEPAPISRRSACAEFVFLLVAQLGWVIGLGYGIYWLAQQLPF
jgi:hypothetical protein